MLTPWQRHDFEKLVRKAFCKAADYGIPIPTEDAIRKAETCIDRHKGQDFDMRILKDGKLLLKFGAGNRKPQMEYRIQ